MPTELVLLSDVALTADTLGRATAALHPLATLLDYHDGLIRQVVDGQGRALLSVYPSRPVLDRAEAETAVVDPPVSFGLWTDMTIPFGDPTDGRAVAEAVAAAIGGVVKERV